MNEVGRRDRGTALHAMLPGAQLVLNPARSNKKATALLIGRCETSQQQGRNDRRREAGQAAQPPIVRQPTHRERTEEERERVELYRCALENSLQAAPSDSAGMRQQDARTLPGMRALSLSLSLAPRLAALIRLAPTQRWATLLRERTDVSG
jgi:hypothetical protein